MALDFLDIESLLQSVKSKQFYGTYMHFQRDTSLTIPDTQQESSFSAGNISRIPDTQQPMSDEDQTMDPGSSGLFGEGQDTVLVSKKIRRWIQGLLVYSVQFKILC